jgi:hypothetical protein
LIRLRKQASLPVASLPLCGPSWPPLPAGRSGVAPRRPSPSRPVPRARPGSVPYVDARASRAGSPPGARPIAWPLPRRFLRRSLGSYGGTPRVERPRRSGGRGSSTPAQGRGRPAQPDAGVVGCRVVLSRDLPALRPASREARLPLPSRGSLGPRFPTCLGTLIR